VGMWEGETTCPQRAGQVTSVCDLPSRAVDCGTNRQVVNRYDLPYTNTGLRPTRP